MSTNMEPRLHPMKFLKNITLFMLIPLRSLSVFSVRKIIGHRLLPTNNKILSQPQPLFGTTNSEERSPNLDTSNTYLADHSQTNAYGILNFVTILWGSQHVVIKSALDSYPSSSTINLWRFLVSSILFLPAFGSWFSNNEKGKKNREVEKSSNASLRAGVELGAYTFLGFGFQAVGLETTTASRAAFLLYLNVKFVPFLACMLFGRQISRITWLSAFVAFCGTAFLSTDGGPLNVGDLWCMAAAMASAMFILRLEGFSKKAAIAEVNLFSFATTTVLCALWAMSDVVTGHLAVDNSLNPVPESLSLVTAAVAVIQPFLDNPLPVLFLGLVASGLGNYLQAIGQRTVPAEKAALVYSLDPVYGAFFSRLFLGEQLGYQGYFGCSLILLAIWISSLDKNDGSDDNSNSDKNDNRKTPTTVFNSDSDMNDNSI